MSNDSRNPEGGGSPSRPRGSRGGQRQGQRGGARGSRGGQRTGVRGGSRGAPRSGPRGGSRGPRTSDRAEGPARPAPAAGGGGAAVSTAAATRPPRPPHMEELALAAWDLARTRRELPDTARGQIMTLRTHQRLVSSFETARAIPDQDRSYLRVRDGAKGSCLLVHGVSTRPGDLHDLASLLYDNGFNVYVLRLPDFGTPGHTISEVSWESSLNQVRQCFRLLARGGGKVHVVGLGFGATLAVHVASLETVSSLVLLAPSLMPRESFYQRLVVRLKLHRVRWIHRLLGWNADLMEGMDRARGRVGRIRAPIFAAQCEDDDLASPTSLRFLQRKARNRASRFKVFADGGHAILAAHGESVLNREILRFCEGE